MILRDGPPAAQVVETLEAAGSTSARLGRGSQSFDVGVRPLGSMGFVPPHRR